MRTYIQGDEEIVCGCNYFTNPLIADYENEWIICSVCLHKELMPSYFDMLTEEELFTFYTDPKKKVYDFGKHSGVSPGNEVIINHVRDSLKKLNLL